MKAIFILVILFNNSYPQSHWAYEDEAACESKAAELWKQIGQRGQVYCQRVQLVTR